jgi:DNA topoisomerase-1
MPEIPREYVLIVAEKPDVATRIAAAIGGDQVESNFEYILCRGKTNYVIMSAVGHLFSLAPAYPKRDVRPVLDLHWVPLSHVDRKRKDIDWRIRAFKSLSKHASKLIIACDYDLEGDTIGYNILKHACGAEKVKAFRAKFSTLTNEELAKSFSELKWQQEWPMAEAGRTRHFLDFVWGVNLSRVLTDSLLEAGGRYATLSIGRVQGPTLNYIHEREGEIRTHVPVPYWRAKATIDANGNHFSADYTNHRIEVEAEAKVVKQEVEGKKGVVAEATKQPFTASPPPPFNLGDLQHEAYRILGLTPTQTLSLSEKLYLQAVISYPRTSSQQIPSTIGYEHILDALSRQDSFRSIVTSLMGGILSPIQGQKSDSAHPAIYPTGEPLRDADTKERRLYDLIVRRFLSAFAKSMVKERHSLKIACGKYEFRASATSITSPGWSAIYNYNDDKEAQRLPSLKVTEVVTFVVVDVVQSFDTPPSRYNQSTLLERMEKDEIGTKATRADVISTLLDRGYILGKSLELSELGFAIVEAASKYSPSILSIEMTRSFERKLESVEAATLDSGAVTLEAVDQLLSCLSLFEDNLIGVGSEIRLAATQTARAKETLGGCPVCHEGQLVLIRSRKSGKRFVGCSNYPNGCKASAPLPQRGTIKATKYTCRTCGWPMVLVLTTYGRRPWQLCVNPGCPSKKRTLEPKSIEGGPS